MELQDMRYILAVAQHRHFTNTSFEVHLSESAISKRIAKVEKEIGGIRLFERNTRNVSITPKGELFIESAKRILDEYDKLIAQINQESGQLSIGILSGLGKMGFSSVLASFCSLYPDIRTMLCIGNSTEQLRLLLNGKTDMAFVILMDEAFLEKKHISHYPVIHDEIAFIAHKSHPYTKKSQVSWQDLANERFILLNATSGTRHILEKSFRQYDITPQVIQECDEVDTILDFVNKEMGPSLLAKRMVGLKLDEYTDVRMIPIVPVIGRITSLMLLRRNETIPTIALLKKYILGHLF